MRCPIIRASFSVLCLEPDPAGRELWAVTPKNIKGLLSPALSSCGGEGETPAHRSGDAYRPRVSNQREHADEAFALQRRPKQFDPNPPQSRPQASHMLGRTGYHSPRAWSWPNLTNEGMVGGL